MDTRNRVGIYGWVPGDGGVNFFRVREPLRVLADHGNVAFAGAELHDGILERVDTVLTHSLWDPDNSQAWEMLARQDTHRLVLDVDDAMWAPDWHVFRRHWTADNLNRLYRNVAMAHVVTTPTDVIADHLARYNRNVHVVPNTVPHWLTEWEMPAGPSPSIGYQGSSSHVTDWTTSQAKHLARFLAIHDQWHINLYGEFGDVQGPPGRTHLHGWQKDVHDHWQRLSMTVGIGPLRPTLFNRAKSSLRAIEYSALGIIPVLPDLELYRGWITDGWTGRLVHSHQTLFGVLHEIASMDPDDRREMADRAHGSAGDWTTERCIEKWVNAWHSL
jgi:hypothetical protein